MILIEEKVLNSFISRYVKQFWMLCQLLTEHDDYEKVYDLLQEDASLREINGEFDEHKEYTKYCLLKNTMDKMQ